MRIISKFRDYYDTAQGYGFDPTVTYVRNLRELSVKDLPFIDTPGLSEFYWASEGGPDRYGILFFCGKRYPFIRMSRKEGYKTYYKYHYSYETINALVLKHIKGKANLKKRYRSKNRYEKTSIQGKLKLYFQPSNNFEENVKLHERFNAPVFVFYLYNPISRNGKNVTVNPPLKELGLQIVFDPFSAHQEIDMFLSGVMQSPEKNIIQIDDESQKFKKGFDDMSFKPKMRAKSCQK